MQKPTATIVPGHNQEQRPLHAIIEVVPDALTVITQEGTVLDVNRAFEKQFGISRSVCYGRNLYELVETLHSGTALAGQMREHCDRAFRSCRSSSFEYETNGFRGRYLVNPLCDEDCRVAERLLVVIEDITTEKRLEIEAEAELRLKTMLLDALPAAAIVLDDQGRMIIWNEFARTAIFGLSDEEMSGLDPLEIIHPDDQKSFREKLNRVFHEDVTECGIGRAFVHDRQRYVWNMSWGKRVVINDRICILMVGIDIDERKMLEEELARKLHRWDAILQKWHIGLWEIALDEDTLLRANVHGSIFGYDSADVKWSRQEFLERIVPEDRPAVQSLIDASFLEKREYSYECRIRRNDGALRWIRSAAAFRKDDSGKPTHLYGIIEDITERKQASLEKQELQLQLQQSQKMQLVGQLAGGIAHDFNNVLMAILGNTELLMETFDPAHPAVESLEVIRQSARRSADMVRQLLGFARKQMVVPRVLDPEAELDTLRPMFRMLITENIVIHWNLAQRHSQIFMDPSQLIQTLTNLVVNARDAIAVVSGSITIDTAPVFVSAGECKSGHPCRTPGHYFRLTVSDTGCGIEKAVIAHIFEPFFTTKEAGKGTGLGLSTVYGIVRQNEGYIECRSQVGVGSMFTIWLPENAESGMGGNEVSGNGQEEARRTILLVEDDPEVRRLLQALLQTEGFRVFVAADAEIAMMFISEYGSDIDIMVTDIILPGMNGVELVKRLREIASGVSVLYMSGYTQGLEGYADSGMEEDRFIAKPFSLEDFMGIIDEMLKRRAES